MNYKDIQSKSDAELMTLVKEQREALRALRFGSTGIGGNDVKKIREAKEMIAWGRTELSTRRNTKTTNPTNA